MANIYLSRVFPACAFRLEATNRHTSYVVNLSFWKWKKKAIQCSGVLRIYLPREFQACALRWEASNGLARVRLRSIYDFWNWRWYVSDKSFKMVGKILQRTRPTDTFPCVVIWLLKCKLIYFNLRHMHWPENLDVRLQEEERTFSGCKEHDWMYW